MRLSYEIVVRCTDPYDIVLVGIGTRGVSMAELQAENISRNSGVSVPVGAPDITFDHDDLK